MPTDMNDETPEQQRARQIADARAALAERYAADPDAVQRFEARKANIEAVRRRERQRFDHLVIGEKRPPAKVTTTKRQGKKRKVSHPVVMDDSGVETALRQRENWSHKQGHAETHAKFEQVSHHCYALVRMEERGEISADQRSWATEIAMVAEGIEADVEVRAVSYEPRIDNSASSRDRVIEGIIRVRRQVAYTHWRARLPDPKRMILDMIVGDQMSYNAAARIYHVGWRKTKRLLIEAIDRWPDSVDFAQRKVSAEDVAVTREELYG